MRVHQRSVVGLLLVIAIGTVAAQNPVTDERVRVWGARQPDDRVDFYAASSALTPMWLIVEFQRLVGFSADRDLPWRGAIPAGTERHLLFSIRPDESVGSASYRFAYRFADGDPSTADHDDGYLYLFPYAHGTKHRITQGYNGAFSHFDDNRYAVDFDLAEGMAVHAARGGVVVRVKEDSRVGGPAPRFAPFGNVVMVAHDDGSFGNYVHLQYRGAVVEIGDVVSAGQLLGYSGATGLASGPHLHFDIRLPRFNGTMQSIPLRFRGPDGQPIEPRKSDVHYAVHPGGPEFEVVYGADLTEADFAGFQGTVARNGRIETRVEQSDLTYAVFVGNGLDYAVDATVTFRLVNMRADTTEPIQLRLQPGEERFLTLLRANPESDRWQYAPTIRFVALR